MLPVALVTALTILLATRSGLNGFSSRFIKCSDRISSATYYSARRNHISLQTSDETEDPSFSYFLQYLKASSLSAQNQCNIISCLKNIGFTNSDQLQEFSRDFVDRPETLSKVLQEDFGLTALMSHQLRPLLIRMVKDELMNSERVMKGENKQLEVLNESNADIPLDKKMPLFKSVVVNKKAKQRHNQSIQENENEKQSSHSSHLTSSYNYGVPSTFNQVYPTLAQEMQDFMRFMTQPQANGQEPPIRKSTAQVYIRHAKLFLGWWIQHKQMNATLDISLQTVFPNSLSVSAEPIISFILWLRQERQVTDSYEANMLRGLTKLTKFRFIDESRADPSYGEKTFHDIPIIRELRKLHREANKKQALSPRSSDERLKWITWVEYLKVVQALKDDLINEIQLSKNGNKGKLDGTIKAAHRRIATKYQYYLIVAIFSHVPDRQRTIRELELGRTLHHDSTIKCWVIKHGPDDYKTGATYGDRPPLILPQELSVSIDDFLNSWRVYLKPTGSHLFAQTRTGRPLTQDSVYSIVARSCYKYAGKKTNPHLLRDMIVTHVRNSKASEKELEALALYMGHSISMQRSSYDRRTMQQKIAPAIELLKSVNDMSGIE